METTVFASQIHHPSPGLICPPPEKTQVQQHFKDSCDIHVILRHIESGNFDPSVLKENKGFYADVSELGIEGLADAYRAVQNAQADFMEIPAEVRKKFDDDQEKFFEYVDEHGIDSVIDMVTAAQASCGTGAAKPEQATKEQSVGESGEEPK